MIKGIVFDMDGTVLDTELQYFEGWKKAIEADGRVFDIDLFNYCCGRPMNVIREAHLKRYGNDLDFEAIRQAKVDYSFDAWNKNGIVIKDGFKELISYAKDNGIKTAIATSTKRESVDWMLNKAGIVDCFDEIVCGDEIERGKPNPDIYLKAASKIGVKPENCVGVEDSSTGLLAVCNAKMTAVFVPDLIPVNDEIRGNADYIVETLADIIQIVKKCD